MVTTVPRRAGRVCTCCRRWKPASSFGLPSPQNRTPTHQLQSWCKACFNKAKSEKRYALVDKVNAFKLGKGCADCGYREYACALQFDHLPGTVKKFQIANALFKNEKLVWEEIAKCEVVCANCHAIRTHTRRPNRRTPLKLVA